MIDITYGSEPVREPISIFIERVFIKINNIINPNVNSFIMMLTALKSLNYSTHISAVSSFDVHELRSSYENTVYHRFKSRGPAGYKEIHTRIFENRLIFGKYLSENDLVYEEQYSGLVEELSKSPRKQLLRSFERNYYSLYSSVSIA